MVKLLFVSNSLIPLFLISFSFNAPASPGCKEGNDSICVNDKSVTSDTEINHNLSFIYNGDNPVQGSQYTPFGRLIFESGENSNLFIKNADINVQYFATKQSPALYGQQAIRLLDKSTLNIENATYNYYITHDGIGVTFPTSWQAAFYLNNSNLMIDNINLKVTHDATNNKYNIKPSGFILDNNSLSIIENSELYSSSVLFNLNSSTLKLKNTLGEYAEQINVNSSEIYVDNSKLNSKGNGFYLKGNYNKILFDNSTLSTDDSASWVAFYVKTDGAVNDIHINNNSLVKSPYLLYSYNAVNKNSGQTNSNVFVSDSVVNGQVTTQSDTQEHQSIVSLEMNNSAWKGNAVSGGNSFLDINLKNNSIWSGRIITSSVDNLTGKTEANLENSTWNITDNSNIDGLNLKNSSVDFTHPSSSAEKFSSLNVTNLSGNGAFTLRTDIVGDGDGVNNAGDKLVVTGSSQGDYILKVLNRGSLATTGNETLTVVETADGVARFTAASEVELGGYLYDVRKNGNNWELYSSGADIPPEPEKPKPPITTTADAGGNFLNVGYLINYAETQTLMQRMGDLRQNGGEHNAWLRGFGGKFNSFAGGKMSGFDMTYGGTQLGFDKRISPDTPLYIGTFAGLTQGSPDYRGGDGTVRSYHLGLYTTYMADNGFYVDGIARASRLKNKFSVSDSQNNNVSGDGSSTGVSLSAEAGRKFSLSRAGNGFYIEPQAQLTYSHQDSTGIHASNGLKIDLGSYDSTIGRAGTLIGYETTTGESQINVYLKTGFVREFQGNTDYKLNGSREAHSFKGNWWNNGLGISANVSKKHTLYAEADSSTGNRFDQYQINGGYRFSF